MLKKPKLFHWKWCLNIIRQIPFSAHLKCKHPVRLYSILRQSFITDMSLDIDINHLKQKQREQMRLGKRLDIRKMVNDELESKCSKVIGDLDAEKSRLLKAIQLEHDMLYAEGYAITPPDKMTSKNWVEAMTLASKEERFQYYFYTQSKANKPRRPKEEEILNPDFENNNCFISAEDNDSATRWEEHRLAQAMTYGQPLVFDMEFDDFMSQKEIGRAAKQLWTAYCINREHPQPFHFVFTGSHKNSSLYRTLELRHLLNCHHFLVSEMKQSYLDIFPSSQLVYLSPNAKHVLREFDPNAVYILGTYSDVKSVRKFGPAKAKEQNISCLKFPIDENIKWIQGSKDLMLNSAVKVLLGVKAGMGWEVALASALHSKHFQHYP